MANSYENVGSNQNTLHTNENDFLGFHEGSNDLPITPYPTVPRNDASRNSFLMSNTPENQNSRERYGDITITPLHESQNQPFMRGSHGLATGFKDIGITQPIIQQNNVEGNDTDMSHARSDSIAFTGPSSGQNSALFDPGSFKIWGGINHTGTTYDSFNNHESTANTSRNLSRLDNNTNRSRTGIKCVKRVRFRFDRWSKEEENVMDLELQKCTFFPIKKISVQIARLLPNKSVRDVRMRIQWLIKHEKLDDIWGCVEPSPGGDWSDLNFYLPDNPNDPDLLAIQNMFHPPAIKRRKI